MSIRNDINRWLDMAEARGMATYGKSLEDADDGRDWRDELIQELVDGLQYAAKELKELRSLTDKLMKQVSELNNQLRTPFDD